MPISNRYATHYKKIQGGACVEIDPQLHETAKPFKPLIRVIEYQGHDGKQAVRVVSATDLALTVEQARKFGMVVTAAGHLCALAEDYGSLERAWFYSHCKPHAVVTNLKKSIH